MNSYLRSTKLFLFSTLLATALECGGGSTSGMATLKGRVSDGAGSQPQTLRILSGGSLGGSGSASAAVKVRVSAIKADGTLSVMAEAQVKVDGRYEIAVPAGQKRLICESLDASGNVVASAIVESTGSAGQTVTVTPLDTESSVEAAVLTKMAASGVALAECNAIDLRERINLNVAVAVKAAADAEAKIKALAEATAAAQRAKVMAYASAGVNTSQSALFDAQLAAALKLNAALDASASVTTADKAYADFDADLNAMVKTLDASDKKHARAEACASVAFRATVQARLQAGGTVDVVADAAVRSAAALEARAAATAVEAILAAGSAASTAISAQATADAMLRAQIAAATSANASAMAFATWNTSVTGGGSVSGSVVGNLLGVNLLTATTAQVAVTAIGTAATVLDTALNTVVKTTLTATGAIDLNALAQSIVTAYATFQSTIDATVPALSLAFGAKAQVGVDVMATTSGSFRLQ